jgi:drug/metabolite transporter (DMT)-like permease
MARALLLGTVVLWGWTFVATKLAVAALAPVTLLALRLAIGLPVLVPIALLRRARLGPLRGDRARLGVAAALLLLHFLVQITGIRHTSATNTGWLVSTAPLFVAALSRLLLKERLGALGLAGLGVATAGILLLVSRGRPGELAWIRSVGDWLVLGSALTWALYTVTVRDLARRRDPVWLALLLLAPSLLVALVATALSPEPARLGALGLEVWLALLFLGVGGTALGHWWWQVGVARIGAARAGTFLYLEPVATSALAGPLLGEPLPVSTLAGGALVLAGVYLGQRGRGDGSEAGRAGARQG